MTIFGGRHIVIPPLMQMRTRGPKTAAVAAAACYYLHFDGNDYGTFSGVSITPPYSVAFWIKRDNSTGDHGVLKSAAGFYYIMFTGDQMYTRHYYPNISTYQTATEWSHYGINFIGNSAPNQVFLNGVQQDDSDATAYDNTVAYDILGCLGGSYYLEGDLAAIGIAPNTIDIAALYAAGTFHKPLNPAVWTSLCLNLKGGSGTTLDDESASGNDCTLASGDAAPSWAAKMEDSGPPGWSDT